LRKGDAPEAIERFHLYAQWLAQEQIDELTRDSARRRVQLYLDLPLGVNPDSYDVWRSREVFALDAAVGAPPDIFFTRGQNWGFPPLHPERLRAQGYRYALDFLRFQMSHADVLRVDHVMGLHRLYWIPQGFPASRGAYVNYPAEEWHAILSLESHRHRTRLAGENLGTVPREVNEAMQRHALRETFVLQYEQRNDPDNALRTPPKRSVASVNTHDMPTFAAHWRGLDLADRAALGLIRRNKLPAMRAERRRMNRALAAFLSRDGVLKRGQTDARSVLTACLRRLGKSSSEFVLVNLEDLWLEPFPQNVPGTVHERPNWRRKARWSLDQIRRDPGIRRALEALRRARAGS